MVYSYSRINAFKQCPRKFAFAYLEKPKIPKVQNIEAYMGEIVHRALYKLYNDLLFSKTLTLQELLDYFEAEWQKSFSSEIQIIRSQFSVSHYLESGKDSLKKYYKRHYPFLENQTLGLERKIQIPLTEKHHFQGIIDRLARGKDGLLEIHDYKTSRDLPTLLEQGESDQLNLYRLIVAENFPSEQEIKLVWHYLLFDTSLIIKKRVGKEIAIKEKLLEEILKIESASSFPTNPSNLCNWCEFQSICPAWEHKFATKDNKYQEEEGSLLVEKLALLEEEFARYKEEYEEERKLLKEAILDFAKRHKLERVFGTSHLATIKTTTTFNLPKKGDEARVKLEALIKKYGLWEELSDLNIKTLEKRLVTKDFKEEVLKKLLNFVKEEKSFEVRIKNYTKKEEDQ